MQARRKLHNPFSLLLMALCASISIKVTANDLSDGSGSSGSGSSSQNQDSAGPIIDANSCPRTLKDWIKDDFTDKSTLKVFQFPSEAKACTTSIRSYEDYLKKSGQKTDLGDAESFSEYLTKRYPQVAPSAKAALSRCNGLQNGQDKIAKTRYYMAAQKFESYSTSIVDELAYIDSVVPGSAGLSKIECNPQFPFPQLAKRCADYKKLISKPCKTTPEQKMKNLVNKSYASLYKIGKLQEAHKACTRKHMDPKKCDDIQIVIKRLEAESPWLASEEFVEVRHIMRSKSDWYNAFNKENIQKRITKYFNNQRDILAKQYASNLNHVRCMTYNSTDNQSNCKFEGTRELLTAIPDIPDAADKKIRANREYDTHMEAEKCMIERGVDREKTKKLVDDSAMGIGVTVATAGLGALASGGLKIIQGMSGVNRMRAAAGTVTATAGVNLSVGVKQAIESCSKESEAVLKFSKTPEAMEDNVCPDPTSSMSFIKDAESSCMTDALLTTLDVWPFVKGLRLVGAASKEELLALYKDPRQREAVEEILRKNGQLDDPQRMAAADTMLGRKLSATEQGCIRSAHSIGDGKFMRTTETEALGLPLLSQEDLLNKKTALSKCFPDAVEVSLLMRSGITGTVPAVAATNISNAATRVLGRSLKPGETQAIWDAATMKPNDAIESLMKAGFSKEEAAKIAAGELRKAGTDQLSTLASNSDAANRANSGGPPANKPAGTPMAQMPAAKPEPPPPSTPTTTAGSTASSVKPVSNNNPFNDPAYRGQLTESSVDKSNITATEARMAVSRYADIIKEPNGPGRNYNAILAMAKNTVSELAQARKALAYLEKNYATISKNDRNNIPVLKDTIARLERRCANIPYAAAQAGLNGSSLQNQLNEIVGGCN